MNNWVRIRGADSSEIANWCNENYVTYERHNRVINPNTFEMDSDWFIIDEKELVLFKLRWGGNAK